MNTLVGTGPLRLVADSPTPVRLGAQNTTSGSRDPRHILARHLPNMTETACSTCHFVYSKERPLCPPVAEALRKMVASGPTKSLSSYSTTQLRAMQREHCGTGRCRRCGFVYTPSVRLCPTSRRIALELETRFKAPISETNAGQGLCSGKGTAWTVTGNESAPWRQAIAACAQCPLLAQCATELDRKLSSGEKISDQILAGRLFSTQGAEIDVEKFDEYADRRGMKTKSRNSRSRRRPTGCTAMAPKSPVPAENEQLTLFGSAAA